MAGDVSVYTIEGWIGQERSWDHEAHNMSHNEALPTDNEQVGVCLPPFSVHGLVWNRNTGVRMGWCGT